MSNEKELESKKKIKTSRILKSEVSPEIEEARRWARQHS